jgi:hypothetical protein
LVFAINVDMSDSFLISQAREIYRMIDGDSEDEEDEEPPIPQKHDWE